ncbi:PaaI family thioesterase [Roseobacter sp. MED193]|uniref:PaaI family thioesterase n=1 Tax=Roseobacter sp. MED193 TaxID=314262 RepID=UPI000324108E|nr:PaaI family thioesterase [Roseobacter sp. MED193]
MSSTAAMSVTDAQALLDENFAEWVRALDLTVTDFCPQFTVLHMPLAPHLARVGGIVSGQALAALADTAMVLAAVAHAGEMRMFATTDLHTQFLRPGVGSAIQCRAEVVRAGKALVFTRAEMREESSDKLVATATATFYAP